MKWLYFRMSGGEYCDDIYGVVEMDAEFADLLARGRTAVEACGAAFCPNRPEWYGDVVHPDGWYVGLTFAGVEDVMERMTAEERTALDRNERCCTAAAPPVITSEDERDTWYERIEGEKVSFDYRGVSFECRVRHLDHPYWAGTFSYEELGE